MSRRIVQIVAVPTASADAVASTTELYALDQNGVVWIMTDPGPSKAVWVRLPELPAIAARGPVTNGGAES